MCKRLRMLSFVKKSVLASLVLAAFMMTFLSGSLHHHAQTHDCQTCITFSQIGTVQTTATFQAPQFIPIEEKAAFDLNALPSRIAIFFFSSRAPPLVS